MTICQRKEEEERERENEKAPEKEGEKNIYFLRKWVFYPARSKSKRASALDQKQVS